ncbi:MAG: hypothetical protein QHH07_02500 [Sedimentisphaerales bacterium]|nr:hypothetical protein [Sedimentisphaerales bacterium]
MNLRPDPCEAEARLFLCPADRGGVPGDLYQKAYQVNGTSYQTNIFLVGQDRCGSFSQQTSQLDLLISERLSGTTINKVSYPGLVVLIGDFGWVNQWMSRNLLVPEWKALAEWHGKADYHNVGFVDGHVEFIRIRKDVYVADHYAVLPFKDLYGLAHEVQWQDQ